MGEAGLEGKAVDDGLQRGPRRAHRARHVDGTETVGVEIAWRADMRQHLAGAMVERNERRRKPPAEGGDVLARQLLEVGLGARIYGEAMHEARLVLLDL